MGRKLEIKQILSFNTWSYSIGRPVLQIALAVLLTGTTSSCDNSTTALNIGVLHDSQSRNGAPTVQPAQLAVEQINAKGGLSVKGQKHTIQLIVMDSGSTPVQAMKAAQKLISDNVVAIIGPNTSRTAIPVAGLAENAKVPLITPIATHVDITKKQSIRLQNGI